jgi:hypothetical protein
MKHCQVSLALWLAAVLPAGAAGAERAPVLVELFTSDVSTNSQPAELLLAQLDATAIVLNEHVSSLDSRSLRDRFAAEGNTKRHQAYGDRYRLEGILIPLIVVNGGAQFLGSDPKRADDDIAKAAKRVKVVPRALWADRGVQVEIDGAHAGDRVYLALADDSVPAVAPGGENRGKPPVHVAVCREIRVAGVVPLGGAFYELVELPPQARKQRVIVWTQVGEVGAVAGATMLPPADSQ